MDLNVWQRRRQPPPPEFADESRILAEGQKDGERNIPEMGSYTPAPFEETPDTPLPEEDTPATPSLLVE